MNIPNYPKAKLESKIYCKEHDQELYVGRRVRLDSIRIRMNYPHEVITIYDAPDLKAEKLRIGNELLTIYKQRAVMNDNSEVTVAYLQDDYSNVVKRSMVIEELRKIFSTLIENEVLDNPSLELDFKRLVPFELPKKLEIKFENGIKHIIEYDSSFQKYAKQCMSNLKVSDLKMSEK